VLSEYLYAKPADDYDGLLPLNIHPEGLAINIERSIGCGSSITDI
jgi:hypothetical protein